ncbi:uracil phosphoribosyltransferase [Methanobacterium paludis]|uniref:Uracil phosphoribosyltransferase n=1 Tax=Methanobacterium paludis (strain DSM 25820 / JCM 18151 / SWAN1) TaxID=868131 RepID=F6D1W2_METPW|nr:uracil phosphoribosyltransferase [Methanobacterium paludis]AEG19034.1 uracil phosphoribosyltransferase [Methanobacterium paludis]
MIKKVDHLLVQEKLTKIREKGINSVHFRAGMIEIGRLISYKFANTLEAETIQVETPLGTSEGIKIKDKEDIVVVNVLRAAIPLVEGVMRVFSEAKCGVVGAWRSDDPPFNVTVGYIRISEVQDKIVVVADPMLATGNTMNAILDEIKKHGTPKRLVIFNVIASKDGIKKVLKNHPEVEIYTCSVEKKLNKEGYIVPGLGDAGDIAFGKPCN